MLLSSKLETASWIAAIVGTAVAVIAFFRSMLSRRKRRGGAAIIQRAGTKSTQIANNTGTIIIGFSEQESHALEPVEIQGKWDGNQAKAIAVAKLQRHDWKNLLAEKGNCWQPPPYRHELLGEYALVYKDRQGTVLAFQTMPENFECHACAPYLSFFEFEKRPRGWNLVGSEISVLRNGAWGYFPKEHISIRVIADNLFGVFLEDYYMAQGQSVSGVTAYARIGDSFCEILDLALGENGIFGEETWYWSSTITIVPTSTGLYDIVVERTGDLKWVNGSDEREDDAADGGIIRPRDVFRFNGRRYVRSTVFL